MTPDEFPESIAAVDVNAGKPENPNRIASYYLCPYDDGSKKLNVEIRDRGDRSAAYLSTFDYADTILVTIERAEENN